MTTKIIKGPVQAEPKPIPNPPGGGSWKWDEVGEKWISQDPVVQPQDKPQE
jgi:hypothetical protein